MSKLLIYIGENEKFDVEVAITAISSMHGVSNPRRGNFIGAIFECEFAVNGRKTIVRMSPELETITAEGLGDESLAFALELQRRLSIPLRAIDMDYSFNVALRDFSSVSDLRKAISN